MLFVEQDFSSPLVKLIDSFAGDGFDFVGRFSVEQCLERALVAQEAHVGFGVPSCGVKPPQLGGDLEAGAQRFELLAIGDDDVHAAALLIGELAGSRRKFDGNKRGTFN